MITRSYIEISEAGMMTVDEHGKSTTLFPRDPKGDGFRIMKEGIDMLVTFPTWSRE
jgi:hypothetical protein